LVSSVLVNEFLAGLPSLRGSDAVLINIGLPPSGGPIPFNAYVALSRGQSQENIRLLRDFDDKIYGTPERVFESGR